MKFTVFDADAACFVPTTHPDNRRLTELFAAPDFRSHTEAKTICASCPAFTECEKALGEQLRSPDWRMTEGTWAGRLFQEGRGDVTHVYEAHVTRRAAAKADPTAFIGLPSSPVSCDSCHADPGEPCWTKRGVPAPALHLGRPAA